MSLLSISNLTKRFAPEDQPVVQSVSFEVHQSEIFALLGPSGCGKTTILRMIGGFERAEQGEIVLNGQTLLSTSTFIRPEKRGIGFVFQDYALFPHLSVAQNVMFGLQALPKVERMKQALSVLDMVGMSKYRDRKPHELSGGQQQRVALARAMAPTPKLILLDEPFSNLDAVLRQETREELRALLKKAGMSAILVTHDQEEALSFADRVAVMHDGKIEQIDTPEKLYYEPKNICVAQFLGRTNLFFCQAEGTNASCIFGPLQLNKAASGSVLVALRPEHLDMHRASDSIHAALQSSMSDQTAEVIGREFKGHDITYRVRQKGMDFLVHTDNRHHFEIGDAVRVEAVEKGVVLERNA